MTSRKTSWKLFWYMFRQYLVPLVCCLMAFGFLFLIMDVFDDLQDFLEADAGLRGVLLYFLVRQPVNLVHVLPMSILLSASYTLCSLSRHHEITAIRAAGVSLVRFCLPVWLVAMVLAMTLFALNEKVGPAFASLAEAMQEHLVHGGRGVAETGELLAYRNPMENRDWLFERFNHQGPQLGVTVKQASGESSRLLWELRAREAHYDKGAWTFTDGRRWRYEQQDDLPVLDERFAQLRIDSFNETPDEIFGSLRPLEELSAGAIMRILHRNPELPRSTKRIFQTTVWYRLTWPLSCFIAAFLGVGLSLGHERASAMRGVALAVGLMVLYYLVAQGFVLLGKYGLMPPVLAGALPPLAFLTAGVRRVYQWR